MHDRVGINTALCGDVSSGAREKTAPSSHIIVWCFWVYEQKEREKSHIFTMAHFKIDICILTFIDVLKMVVIDI